MGNCWLGGSVLELNVIVQLFVKVLSRKELIVKTGTGPLVKVEKVIGENSVQSIIANDLSLAVKARKIVIYSWSPEIWR